MAEEQKPVEVPKEETPAVVAPVETQPVDETKPAEPVAPATEEVKPAEETKPVEGEPAAAAEETKEEVKEEVKPVEEGHLSHKAQGLSFPKNIIPSKEFFWFGTEAVEAKALSAYQKAEKTAEVAQANIAWAAETGKGLLFVGDKAAPSRIINLSDATEPETDGSHKFTFTAKGNKHSFKAATPAERDNWVAQLKLKIAEAKELVATVTESETYKTTLESFKPAPAPAPAPAAEEAPKTEETPAVVEPEAEPAVAAEEAKKEVKEEPKRRSASRKRTSFFGFGSKKEEAKKEETKPEEAKTEEVAATEAVAPVEATEAPVAATEEVKPAETTEAAPVEAAAVTEEAKPAEEDKAAETVESPKEKPAASKRNSFFGNVFSRKEKKATDAKPAETVESPKEEEPPVAPVADETAPVIPPVETTTPLAVDVANPATVPTETTEVKPAVAAEAPKEKRKSSLGFPFGRSKSPGPVEGEEKEKPVSPFSKLRATIKSRATPKTEEKAEAKEEDKTEEAVPKVEEETKKEETVAEPAKEEPKAAEPEAENKPEAAATTAPAVTAAA